jgi:hypothetical protein
MIITYEAPIFGVTLSHGNSYVLILTKYGLGFNLGKHVYGHPEVESLQPKSTLTSFTMYIRGNYKTFKNVFLNLCSVGRYFQVWEWPLSSFKSPKNEHC